MCFENGGIQFPQTKTALKVLFVKFFPIYFYVVRVVQGIFTCKTNRAPDLVVAGQTKRIIFVKVDASSNGFSACLTNKAFRVPMLVIDKLIFRSDRQLAFSASMGNFFLIAIITVRFAFVFQECLVSERSLASGTFEAVEMPFFVHGSSVDLSNGLFTFGAFWLKIFFMAVLAVDFIIFMNKCSGSKFIITYHTRKLKSISRSSTSFTQDASLGQRDTFRASNYYDYT